ncbi:MAG: DNA topoisomerase III [Spirochaetales bacterium]|nr:DNA topoisomerase III [Spirochaetales bacterium]
MKSIVLAEKPSVARDLARVLDCRQQNKTYIEGRDYVVTWAMGHLVELAAPEAYDAGYKHWKLDYLPMLPDKMKHKVIGRTSFQFRAIKTLFQRKDVNELIIATDAGREGELVARWIMRLGGWKGPVKRLWISSQTEQAIKDGFAGLKDGGEYISLFRAAECRAEADWLVGLNVTRAMTCRFDARLSAGRVQTPTLAIIAAREEERKNFVPQNFWQVYADFGGFEAVRIDAKGNKRIFNQADAEKIRAAVEGKTGIISKLKRKRVTQPPPQAFDLTELQRCANRQLDFSAKQTLRVLQGLYERHKLVTYPRTDSRHITTDIVPTLGARIKGLLSTSFAPAAQTLLNGELNTGSHLVNNAKVTDHHAIIPTEQKASERLLDTEELALWRLIVRRFLAVLSPPRIYEKVSIMIDVDGEIFSVSAVHNIDRGWMSLESPDESDEQEGSIHALEGLKQGAQCSVMKSRLTTGQTSPPPRFSEASLLTAMEKPHVYITDTELRKALKDAGLGTPATRADIIEKLLDKYFIERQGKELVPTAAGLEVLELCPDLLTSPALTARWEQRLTAIEKGQERPETYLNDIRTLTAELVSEVKQSSKKYAPRNANGKECPLCGRQMMRAKGKKGRAIQVCQSFSCGYEEEENRGGACQSGPSRREKQISRGLIHKYSDDTPETSSFGDLIKAAMEKKEKPDREK